MEEELSDVERWQKSEDERLEYEGYCNKIRKGLEDLDEKSGERALWELVQNARDTSSEARIKVELNDTNIIFSHHGKPFDYTSFRALAYIIHSGFISGYQNRYGDNLKPPTNVYHRMTA